MQAVDEVGDVVLVVEVVDVVVVVLVPHAVCAVARSAASCCCALAVFSSSPVNVFWSAVMVAALAAPVVLPPVVSLDPVWLGVVVVVVLAAAADWLSSSSISLASSEETDDWAEETVSDSAVVSRVASDWPAVTCWPTVAVSVPATLPATWKTFDASLTGSTVPMRAMLLETEAFTTVAMR